MIDITGLREDKRPQSSTIVHALLDRLEAAEKERDALRAKIEQMEKQEPVGTAMLCAQCSTPFDGDYYCPTCGHHTATEETVYALPGAQAQSAPSVPDGWKLVPIVSTDEMDNAGSDHCDGYLSTAQAVWDAMLAAAPEAKS